MYKKNYKDTLNLPKTDFTMKANLPQKEPTILKLWQEMDIYNLLRERRKGRRKYILHDGPPYANGNIHMGHVLNKILKDIVVKFYTMQDYDAPFVPGWDCHGLPVEHQLFKELGISKYDISQLEFRKKAFEYAMKYVEIQKEEFKRLGVFASWERPYLTLDARYEAEIIRAFGKLVEKGYIYKDLKPVNWCPRCETALAEAEVEYEDKKSPSIFVKFKVKSDKESLCKISYEKDTYFIIWTTTPWTLLGNVAIAVHPELDYAFLDVDDENWVLLDILAHGIVDKLKRRFKLIKKVKGKELENILCQHPFIERKSRVVLAEYVSQEEGTGCVHIAPGHGQEDYVTGKKYNLPIIMPVDSEGKFDESTGEFRGLSVYDANTKILDMLKKKDALLISEEITHSYPHCWRCKKPIIFRATKQYFMSIDHMDLRKRMLETITKDVRWFPELGRVRISSMVENRPDWCLSRQRYWGVPIVAFICKGCGEYLLDRKVIDYVAEIVENEGSDAFFAKDSCELLPKGTKCEVCGENIFEKEGDIIDVWFESGVSHQFVLKIYEGFNYPSQLYLEGSDQHRGWFQSALITAIAIDNDAPYESVVTHGFVVDGEGKKMSKSLGNVISPQDVMKRYGADILRLWAASTDYHDDIRLSDEILQRLSDAYRKIRNTFRYILGNLYDFNPEMDYVQLEEMEEIDRWILSRVSLLIKAAKESYQNFAFHRVFRLFYNFCVYEISSFYLDVLKDRLYTFYKDSKERKSCQTALFEVLLALLKVLAPIIPFTTEEAWQHLSVKKEKSIHQTIWHWTDKILESWHDEKLDNKWQRLLELREEVLKAMELKRMERNIGSSLEARVILYTDKEDFLSFLKENESKLTALFITSEAKVSSDKLKDGFRSEKLPLWISVERAHGSKCQRCWNYNETVGMHKEFVDICSRCIDVISKIKA